MAIFKCKMCGGCLDISEGVSVATCEYCGTNQTISKSRDEIVSNLFNRANDLRLKCEFDRAEQTYEKIIEQDNTESEAYWGIVLCRYGIEYVEDQKTGKRIPTCHRTSYEAITSDSDYLAAIENADSEQKKIYEQEAKAIDELQKNILNIVNNEEPFDVFICYKETDENGKRTIDSAISNDIYYQLTQEGYKVFYAPITLEDKLGQEYEPYIFAALNSAKVMLIVGTKPEYFNAVWVKNEWSRYLKLLKTDRSKMIIPCYRDMEAYDLPDEFAHLQSQDMSKIGFINDVVRGIKKVIVKETTKNKALPIIEKNLKNVKRLSGVTAETNKKSNDKNNDFLSRKLTVLSLLLFVFGPMLGNNFELYLQRDLMDLIVRIVFSSLLVYPIIVQKKSLLVLLYSIGYFIEIYLFEPYGILSLFQFGPLTSNDLFWFFVIVIIAFNTLKMTQKINQWTRYIYFLPLLFLVLPYLIKSLTNGIGYLFEAVLPISALFIVLATLPQKKN